jgi:hypothetical protein
VFHRHANELQDEAAGSRDGIEGRRNIHLSRRMERVILETLPPVVPTKSPGAAMTLRSPALLPAVLALAFTPATRALHAQDTLAPLPMAHVETTDTTLQQPATFSFQLGGVPFTVAAVGTVTRGGTDSATFKLPMPDGARIERIYAGPIGSDLLVLYETTNADGGSTSAARLDPATFGPRWTQQMPTVNTAPPLVSATEMYVAGLDFIGRIDPSSGDWIWQKNTLSPRGARAFQAFGSIGLDGQRIAFTEDVRGHAGRVIWASRADGSILEIH